MREQAAVSARPALRRRRVRDEIVEYFLGRLRRGEVRPGDVLPNERALATGLGVSRASLRDAVNQLELLGYLRARQGDGTVVLDPSTADLARPFRNLLVGRPHLARDLLEFRTLLEPGVAALAAERATPALVAALHANLAAQCEAASAGRSLRDLDLAFHELIAHTAGNDVTSGVLSALRELLADLRARSLSDDRPALTLDEHGTIVKAIAAGTPEPAAVAMRAHLANVTRYARQTGQEEA